MSDRRVFPLPHEEAAEAAKAPKPPNCVAPDWEFIEPITLQGVAVQPRDFIVQDWLSRGHVTINYGDGGVGKTLLLQQLMTSAAVERPWCGLSVHPCKSLALFCEDDNAELHRRQEKICAAYGVEFSDLGMMRWASGVGQDNTLASFNKAGDAAPTPAFDVLINKALQTRADMVIVDTAADTFGGDENSRRHVRQFVGFVLGSLAHELNAAVVLNAHPSRTGMTKDMDGASTGWSNTARARWSLTRPEGEGVDENQRLLTRRKSNYAAIGETIRLIWRNGVLMPLHAPGGFAAGAEVMEVEALFMELLAKATAEGEALSANAKANNCAALLLSKRKDACGVSRHEFDAAMQRLFAAGRLATEEYGRNNGRGQPRRIVAVSTENEAIANDD